MSTEQLLRERIGGDDLQKLLALPNPKVLEFIAQAIAICNPKTVMICTDANEDAEKIRRLAAAAGEERPAKIPGHTIHYDNYYDQGRDKGSTKYLVPAGQNLGRNLLAINRDQGLDEIRGLLTGAMRDRAMIVRFFCLGIPRSEFAIPCVQVTDSLYVAHSEDLLYRRGYEELLRRPGAACFRFLHSAGRLENCISADVEKRRVYIDLQEEIVYSVNTQYAGNTVGLKKLALRLAIRQAAREGWLAEHMLVMGVHGPKGRVTYFTGAYPSACGKTSTAMLPGQTIVGDDLAYLKKRAGKIFAANVESGIFGIIQDVSAANDPVIWKVLTSPGEVIFSNVLAAEGTPYWLGDGRQAPDRGYNHSGDWQKGKKDAAGNEIPLAHKNARYTLRLADLANRDPRADDPAGVELRAIVYGGRDSDTCMPIEQSFDWAHGVILKGASLESETTSATLGQEGVRQFNLMSNLDFLSMSIGRYIKMHLDFVDGIAEPPLIFSVNYFLKNKAGQYLNGIGDKRVWLQWAELRVNGDVPAIRTPAGDIPRHADLAPLFQEYFGQTYTREQYEEQFTLRVPQRLAKIERLENIYRAEAADVPAALFDALAAERRRLLETRGKFGDFVSPFTLERNP